MAKFARGNRYSQMEYQEKYKEECRKIFEVQNKSLASNHLTSTDNETSADDDSDVDEMTKNLELMLEPTVSKQTHETKPHSSTTDAYKKSVRIDASTYPLDSVSLGFTCLENHSHLHGRQRSRISTRRNHPSTDDHRSLHEDSLDEDQRIHVSSLVPATFPLLLTLRIF